MKAPNGFCQPFIYTYIYRCYLSGKRYNICIVYIYIPGVLSLITAETAGVDNKPIVIVIYILYYIICRYVIYDACIPLCPTKILLTPFAAAILIIT